MKRPELRHPPIAINCRCDGNKVSALIGPNYAEGVVGFGDNLPEALIDLARALYAEVDEPRGLYHIFRCPQCGRIYEDHESKKECLVGGHWTPHSATDVPPLKSTIPMRCCHQFQRLLPEAEDHR